MENNKRTVKILSGIRWLCPIPGIIMYVGTINAFGHSWAIALAAFFTSAFYFFCSRERRLVLCQSIVEDIKKELDRIGHEAVIYELRALRLGIVVRVYLIKAGKKAQLCNQAILSIIRNGWYKKFVSATQVVDLDNEVDLNEAKASLDEDLLVEFKERLLRGRRNRK